MPPAQDQTVPGRALYNRVLQKYCTTHWCISQSDRNQDKCGEQKQTTKKNTLQYLHSANEYCLARSGITRLRWLKLQSMKT